MGHELLTIPERECLTIYLHEPEEVYRARVSAGLQSDGTQRADEHTSQRSLGIRKRRVHDFIGKRRPYLRGFPRSAVRRLSAAKP
jgi:hypothetical protein